MTQRPPPVPDIDARLALATTNLAPLPPETRRRQHLYEHHLASADGLVTQDPLYGFKKNAASASIFARLSEEQVVSIRSATTDFIKAPALTVNRSYSWGKALSATSRLYAEFIITFAPQSFDQRWTIAVLEEYGFSYLLTRLMLTTGSKGSFVTAHTYMSWFYSFVAAITHWCHYSATDKRHAAHALLADRNFLTTLKLKVLEVIQRLKLSKRLQAKIYIGKAELYLFIEGALRDSEDDPGQRLLKMGLCTSWLAGYIASLRPNGLCYSNIRQLDDGEYMKLRDITVEVQGPLQFSIKMEVANIKGQGNDFNAPMTTFRFEPTSRLEDFVFDFSLITTITLMLCGVFVDVSTLDDLMAYPSKQLTIKPECLELPFMVAGGGGGHGLDKNNKPMSAHALSGNMAEQGRRLGFPAMSFYVFRRSGLDHQLNLADAQCNETDSDNDSCDDDGDDVAINHGGGEAGNSGPINYPVRRHGIALPKAQQQAVELVTRIFSQFDPQCHELQVSHKSLDKLKAQGKLLPSADASALPALFQEATRLAEAVTEKRKRLRRQARDVIKKNLTAATSTQLQDVDLPARRLLHEEFEKAPMHFIRTLAQEIDDATNAEAIEKERARVLAQGGTSSPEVAVHRTPADEAPPQDAGIQSSNTLFNATAEFSNDDDTTPAQSYFNTAVHPLQATAVLQLQRHPLLDAIEVEHRDESSPSASSGAESALNTARIMDENPHLAPQPRAHSDTRTGQAPSADQETDLQHLRIAYAQYLVKPFTDPGPMAPTFPCPQSIKGRCKANYGNARLLAQHVSVPAATAERKIPPRALTKTPCARARPLTENPLNITRILDVAQDLKILDALLDVRPFIFALDVAALASRREYLNLDKWLADNITQHQRSTAARSCPR
ncbi:hypothetical protein AURDEDRAFT_157904 [Auricularia subglabra TFB-10046 SS5]|nr:hypothetical protein AURDEDRAFT_157904 [Auricularia subglabra TFB-10046 SS5]